jgi:PKD repeat protein
LNATWTVNDTSVGQGQSLTYVFPRLGTYSVCENLTTSSGCSSSICNSISITVADTCPIHAAFTASPSTANPYLFNFSDMGTGPIGSFLWSFGDGTTSSVENPTHIYEDTGTYTITLTETTASGLGILCSSTSTLTLIVPEGSTGPNDSDSCAVSISFSPISGKTGAFTLLVAGATNQDSVQWSIVKGYAANSATFIPKDSADIVTLTGINPIYSFPDTGFYTINATTITQSGCQASSGWQNLYIVSPNLIVSPPNTNSIMQIPVYPSPATDHLNIVISLTNYSSVTIDVYNAVGNFVISKKYGGMPGNNQLVLPVQKLPSGVYYIRINDGLNIHNSRFQKM